MRADYYFIPFHFRHFVCQSLREKSFVPSRIAKLKIPSIFILVILASLLHAYRMTQTARMSRAGSKDDEYVFTWKVFTGTIEVTLINIAIKMRTCVD